jgi:hypothetical protein
MDVHDREALAGVKNVASEAGAPRNWKPKLSMRNDFFCIRKKCRQNLVENRSRRAAVSRDTRPMHMTDNDNPFADERLERLDFRMPAGSTWESFLKRCADNNYRGAIVGPMGSGKSVLMAQLAPRLAELGLTPRIFHLSPDSRRAEKEAVITETKKMRAPDILLLDGAEQLQTRDWLILRSVIDGLAGCILTLHRTGRLPTLIETTTTPALLEELAVELTGGRLPLGEAAGIFARGRGNIRECFRELHDRWAGE